MNKQTSIFWKLCLLGWIGLGTTFQAEASTRDSVFKAEVAQSAALLRAQIAQNKVLQQAGRIDDLNFIVDRYRDFLDPAAKEKISKILYYLFKKSKDMGKSTHLYVLITPGVPDTYPRIKEFTPTPQLLTEEQKEKNRRRSELATLEDYARDEYKTLKDELEEEYVIGDFRKNRAHFELGLPKYNWEKGSFEKDPAIDTPFDWILGSEITFEATEYAEAVFKQAELDAEKGVLLVIYLPIVTDLLQPSKSKTAWYNVYVFGETLKSEYPQVIQFIEDNFEPATFNSILNANYTENGYESRIHLTKFIIYKLFALLMRDVAYHRLEYEGKEVGLIPNFVREGEFFYFIRLVEYIYDNFLVDLLDNQFDEAAQYFGRSLFSYSLNLLEYYFTFGTSNILSKPFRQKWLAHLSFWEEGGGSDNSISTNRKGQNEIKCQDSDGSWIVKKTQQDEYELHWQSEKSPSTPSIKFSWGKLDSQKLFDLNIDHSHESIFSSTNDYIAWGSRGLKCLFDAVGNVQGVKGVLRMQPLPMKNTQDLTDFNGAVNQSNQERAEATKMAKMLGILGYYPQKTDILNGSSPNYWHVEVVFKKKECTPTSDEQFAFQNFITESSKTLVSSGQRTICDIVDYKLIANHSDYQNIKNAIHTTLSELIRDYGVKLDAIVVVEDNGGIARIENFQVVNGITFKKRLFINATKFQGITLAAFDVLQKAKANEGGLVQFVYESFVDVINHEYGHLLTTPHTNMIDFDTWMDQVNELILDETDFKFLYTSRKQYNNNISRYSSNTDTKGDLKTIGGGAEMLAEIFCRHRKNLKNEPHLIAPEWATEFNNTVLQRWNKQGKVTSKIGTNLR